jgi:hypothetical protein
MSKLGSKKCIRYILRLVSSEMAVDAEVGGIGKGLPVVDCSLGRADIAARLSFANSWGLIDDKDPLLAATEMELAGVGVLRIIGANTRAIQE